MTRVKICGLTRSQDAQVAIDFGADALGFVFEPSSPRYVGDHLEWINRLPPFPARIAVFGVVNRIVPRGLFDAVQGAQWDVLADPPPRRIHTLRLKPGQRVEDLSEVTIGCSAVVLDAFHEKAWGGTGERVDWDLAAEFVRLCPKPVILAGGLNPDNVAEAVRRVHPYAVDVSSGVESKPGEKDFAKIRDFLQAAKD